MITIIIVVGMTESYPHLTLIRFCGVLKDPRAWPEDMNSQQFFFISWVYLLLISVILYTKDCQGLSNEFPFSCQLSYTSQ